MKRILIIAAVAVVILFLTKLANEAPPEPMPGIAFSLLAQRVVQCSPTEITLVDTHQTETHLEKDDSWPDLLGFRSRRRARLLSFPRSQDQVSPRRKVRLVAEGNVAVAGPGRNLARTAPSAAMALDMGSIWPPGRYFWASGGDAPGSAPQIGNRKLDEFPINL